MEKNDSRGIEDFSGTHICKLRRIPRRNTINNEVVRPREEGPGIPSFIDEHPFSLVQVARKLYAEVVVDQRATTRIKSMTTDQPATVKVQTRTFSRQ